MDDMHFDIVVYAIESVLRGSMDMKLKCLVVRHITKVIPKLGCAILVHNFYSVEELADMWSLI